MEQTVAIRAMQPADVAAVLEIQALCYDAAKLESATSFLAKLRASPSTCFFALLGAQPAGYLVAIPAVAGRPPPLNAPDCPVPPDADALYLHDLAVHPRARGTGVAGALVDAYFQALRQSSARYGSLTAVNASGTFWERHGFRPAPAAGGMASYGDGAQYMTLEVLR